MSEKLPEQSLTLPASDFTMRDLERIEKFKEGGLVGLAKLTEVDIERCMALYMDGKTYRQVANITKLDHKTILYLAHRLKWYELRQDYLDELRTTLPQKVMESKLLSQEFFLHLELAYKKKIGSDVDKYLRTGNDEWFKAVDMDDVKTLMKITELVHKLNNESFGSPNDKSLVALNGLGEGVTLTKTSNNSVEITPKSPFSTKLKAFADLKRQQEKDSQPVKEVHDISNESETVKPESPKNE